jgi:hypothetical protein
MSLNFPNFPVLDEVFTSPDGTSFIWNGTQWVGFSSSVILNFNTVPLKVEDDAITVGTAVTTINFGKYLDVSNSSNRVTVDVNTIWKEIENRIHTFSNVGIGTTNPLFFLEVGEIGFGGTSLYVKGGIKNTGMVTFTSDADTAYNYNGYITVGADDINEGVAIGYIGNKGNLIFGKRSGVSIDSTSRRNIFIGEETGANFINTGSSDNVYIGAYAGASYSDANNNVFIGNGVGYNPSLPGLSGSFNVMIGPSGSDGDVFDVNPNSVLKTPPIEEGSYQLVVGAGNTAWMYGNESFFVGFGTYAPEEKIHVEGNVKISGITTSNIFSVGIEHTYVTIDNSGIDLNLTEFNDSTKINFYSFFPGEDPSIISLEAPSGANNYSLVLPTTSGYENEALITDGNGNLRWEYPSKWYTTGLGIHTNSSVSIGTEDSFATLTVEGDANISGVITAFSFSGLGSNLSGIVTSIVAGENISISTSFGQVEINASLTIPAYWEEQFTGITTSSNVGIGTTIATSTLTVNGNTQSTNILVSGIGTISTINSNTASILSLSSNSGIITSINSTNITGTYTTTANLNSNNAFVSNFTSGISTTSELNVGIAGTILKSFENGLIGIGTILPISGVHIVPDTRIDGSIRVATASTGEFRVGLITTGVGNLSGLLLSSNNGSIVSNNGGSSGGFYLRTNGVNRWFVDHLSNQFNTGRIQIGPTIASSNIRLETNGNASYAGIVTASSFSGTATRSNYADVSGISTISQGLTGTPNISVGVITATEVQVSSGASIAGIVTAIGGFSTGSSPITFTVIGSDLVISVAGIGSTTLTLS